MTASVQLSHGHGDLDRVHTHALPGIFHQILMAATIADSTRQNGAGVAQCEYNCRSPPASYDGGMIPVSRIFVTGSTDGLGRGAAGVLIGEGHDVVLHARTLERAAALSDLATDAAGVVIGDLASAAETRELADQVNGIGRMDAVIHNAGVFLEPSRAATAEGHAKTLAVNTLAPYMLTALIDRPDRLIYLSSGLHHAGAGSLRDIDWTGRQWNGAQAYSESKLQVTALALTVARAWPEVISNAVDPGWVPTKMGGPAATGDLELGYLTQTWLAVSNDAAATVSGGYWYHRQRQEPAAETRDLAFQDQLMDRLAALTGVAFF
jgi:NAD(P)-dependent dehydrogenase (short-subunit alcohol dehydrogenase family)